MLAVGCVTEQAGVHWSRLDFRCGRTAYRRLAGMGNHHAPVTLGPEGTAYVGVLGGVMAFP
jgi:hypothetical protein